MSEAASFDPARVPVRPAATIMLLEDRPDLHVLLLRRRAASDFVPGMYVFPGGGVDAEDATPEVAARCRGLDDATASARLGLPGGGLAYWVAAVRETLEEAGVWLAVDRGSGASLDTLEPRRASRLGALRSEVDAGDRTLLDAAEREDLAFDLDAVHYAARWVTPEGPPRRYDTRFFVAAMRGAQQASHDSVEAVDSLWVRPAEALARFESGEWAMLPPTVGMLRVLAGFSKSEAAVAAAARCEEGPDEPAYVVGGMDWRVVMPGDPDWQETTKTDLFAWVRFRADVQAAEG